MVLKFRELENYDDYDPTPYRGGYDINAAYGGVKAADEECAYRRTKLAADKEPIQVHYGNERNPYERGHPGPSILGGRSKPGAVYGGGRDRTRPRYDEAQPDQVVEERSGSRKPISYGYGEQEPTGYRQPISYGYGEEESLGYHNPFSFGYGEEESGYRNSRPPYGYEETNKSGSCEPAYGYGEEGLGYRKLRPGYGEEERDESGYRNPVYGYGEGGSGYRNPWPAYGEEESSGYRKPYNFGEEEESGGYRRPLGPGYGGGGDTGVQGYGSTEYSREEVESFDARSGYGQTQYGEEGSSYGGYGSGNGGRRSNDDYYSRFFGGSVYTEEPLPAKAPAKRSWW